ncbi:triggering receptor expressed on myeloid cells 2 isoform X1 [Eleutherodactylus coqui]|uniref:Immunoglobulin domain-containing protein n=1 Tax=Eleutherodactylus coqui TaxID=57060 RepID=A0A8J6KAR5_ELECQ|nr:hypothetical protein GDO78_008466 [Eleutherodactylus coqui]
MDNYSSLTFTIILLGISDWCLSKDKTVYTGQLGETLNVVCPYEQHGGRWKKKIWCKEDDVGFCQLVVSTRPFWLKYKRRNVSAEITDNYHKGIITINMTNLQKSDAGFYQCRTVSYSDVTTLQRIQVNVLEDKPDLSDSELINTQYSISGTPSTLTPGMLVAIGTSYISFKLLLLGLIYIWWKKHEPFYSSGADQEPSFIPLSAGHSEVEHSLAVVREERNDYPEYINYVYMGHLNQAQWQQ